MSNSEVSMLTWLQQWYAQYCNGDWEHDEHFLIRNIDNPGWRVTINLSGTSCEGKSFSSVKIEKNETDWVHCFVREGKFEGAGGPFNLVDILKIFRDWVKS